MKALRFLPLAFLAGTHGFAIFAPYLAVVLAALQVRAWQRSRAKLAPVPVPLPAMAAVPA